MCGSAGCVLQSRVSSSLARLGAASVSRTRRVWLTAPASQRALRPLPQPRPCAALTELPTPPSASCAVMPAAHSSTLTSGTQDPVVSDSADPDSPLAGSDSPSLITNALSLVKTGSDLMRMVQTNHSLYQICKRHPCWPLTWHKPITVPWLFTTSPDQPLPVFSE